jgi:diguanylate cyclase (GGDEF)-like protein/PAS domain S-box-containing protein
MPEIHKIDRVRRLLASLLIVVAALLAHSSGILDPLDRFLGDLRFHAGKREPTGRVVLVEIDSRSLQEVGTWPWPRSIHARLVDQLVALGAQEIAFDVDFSASSSSVEDAAFAAALQRAGGGVILATFAQAASGRLGDTGVSYNVPIAQFLSNSWPATVNVLPDEDGRIRSLRYGETISGAPTQSLSAMLAAHPAPPSGDFRVDFSIRADAIEQVSVIDVLRGDLVASRIAGKKVIVGASAIELRDFFHTPVYGVVPGALLQAIGAETLMQGRALQTVGFPLILAGLLVVASLSMLASRRMGWSALLGCLAILSIGIETAAWSLQVFGAVVLHTALWHVALAGFAVFAIGSEIDFRRILLLISRTETRNVRTILDQVIADNFAGVLVVEAEGTIRAASRSALRLLGLDATTQIEGRRLDEVVPSELSEVTHAALRSGAAQAASEPQELRYVRADGAVRLFEYVVTPSRLSGGLSEEGHTLPDQVIATLTFVDVTERRDAAERIAYLARFDTLTGLPNRNHFEENLQRSLDRYRSAGTCSAVLFFDLDRFKAVNDTLGHDYGDQLLTAVARRLEQAVRHSRSGRDDDTFARFGGDEYAVLMAGPVTAREAVTLAERLIEVVGEPYELNGHRLIVGLSVGIALPEEPDTTVGTLMKNADAALYRAKAAGGATYRIFDESIGRAIRARRELEVELWDAFERDEFEVYYQPQVDLVDRRIIGVEALLRWRHAERGYVSPSEFVPVAEAVGLIDPLGRWILRKACAEVAGWPVPVKVAINVSPVQFVKENLAATVEDALTHSRLPAERLNIEITESLVLHENRVITETIEQLRVLGVTFSIDDFGTGYSSLSYLRRFPVQKIKIDQSFVSDLPHNSEAAAIVRAICTLAQGTDVLVNAEGIETEEQARALRLFGCHEGQGYLFGKPQPAAGLLRLLETQSASRRMIA